MRPFDEIPFEPGDDSDVALMVASVREWPSEEFTRDLDARVARRFAPEATPVRRAARARLPRWAAGPAVALVAGAVAAVVVLSGGGGGGGLATVNAGGSLRTVAAPLHQLGVKQVAHGGIAQGIERLPSRTSAAAGGHGPLQNRTPAAGAPSAPSAAGAINATVTYAGAGVTGGVVPVAPGAHQIQSAQISLTTPNADVEQVAQEVIDVVTFEHGTVQNSRVTAANTGSGGGYAYFDLSFPTSHLQAALTQLSRLRDASITSRTDGSLNVGNQYGDDVRQLRDAEALRASLLRQLQSAYTQADIDSIRAQLKLAEQQIASRQSSLERLQHQISHSSVSVQINQDGLPMPVVRHHSSGFTLGRAGHDALRVLVVSAGVALIVLAVLVPVGLVAALLMWLWVWLRQRRREHALDATS